MSDPYETIEATPASFMATASQSTLSKYKLGTILVKVSSIIVISPSL